MNEEELKLEVEAVKKKINKFQKKLLTLQDSCVYHTNTTYRNAKSNSNINVEYDSNTGNWCSADDSYWAECTCKVCGKYFIINHDD